MGGGRGKGHGTGSPVYFACAVGRKEWPRRIGWSDRHTVTLTGRERPYQSSRYSVHGARSTHTAREYRCSCGHVGWSAHIDLAYMAGAGRD